MEAKSKTHKVVYNAEYGGFGLSDEAVRWLEYNAEDEELRNFLQEERKRLSQKKSDWGSIEGCMQSSLKYNFKEHGIPRHHPDLIKVVETLKKKADGEYSGLKIAKIKGNLYRIDEYDGWETVVEPDDYEWIHIDE